MRHVYPAIIVLGGFIVGAGCDTAPLPGLEKNLYSIPYAAFPLPNDNQPTPQRIALGHLLFNDPILSKNHRIACGSCHRPSLGFADGLPLGAALADPQGGELPRSSPTIWNARFQLAQFWDGRAATLEELALQPIENPREMGNTVENALTEVAAISEYRQRFADAYGVLDASSLQRALACFVASVISVNAPVDRYLQGESSAMSAEAIAGFNLYFGKARCSRCHYLPLFAGTEGPAFNSVEFKITGVPERGSGPRRLTSDQGRAAVPGVEPQPSNLHAFKTPTLRNIAHTAPYFSSGAYDTLEEVVDFYNKGAGPGQAYDVPNLDPILRQGPMGLSPREQQLLIIFLREGLTDLSTAPPLPAKVPSALIPGGVPREP